MPLELLRQHPRAKRRCCGPRIYDGCGRLPPVCDGTGPRPESSTADCARTPVPPAAPEPAPVAAAPCLRHGFAFRLCGAEAQSQTLALEGLGGAALIVAIERVRAYLTGAEPAAATSAIGGIEVHAALDGGRVVCTAQLSDFQPSDLVVVQIDVALYRVGASR